MNVQLYTKQPDQYNLISANDFESAADRYARRVSHQSGFSVAHVRAALLANAAVKEH
ncbi:MAG: hypothetical protein Q7T45_09140 [Bradyrhizobium sp.]|uniref:hypothetical protein n=1 Tax=Bradyrhizobium sp. TaxID=376 RepID=UPI0027280423|nr:hypothetical protein [Bradyrhizobium sp.]MDO8397974.1 hypothetical protein [Bradyrhizobium sp.]